MIKKKYKFLVLGIILLGIGLSMEVNAQTIINIMIFGNLFFLSGIGMTIYGAVRYNKEKKKEPAIQSEQMKEKVSIKRQTIFACIPILYLYAAYKVEKFRLFFAIYFGIQLVDYFVVDRFIQGELYSTAIEEAFFIPIAVYLIRRWSKDWNHKLDASQSSITT